MSKSDQAEKDAIQQVLDWATPRLVLITAVTGGVSAANLENPANWTEATQFATTNRISLAGKLPTISAATTSGTATQITLPTSDVDAGATVSGSSISVVAIAIVDGTAALASTTKARVVDIADKTFNIGDTIRFAANSWTLSED